MMRFLGVVAKKFSKEPISNVYEFDAYNVICSDALMISWDHLLFK